MSAAAAAAAYWEKRIESVVLVVHSLVIGQGLTTTPPARAE